MNGQLFSLALCALFLLLTFGMLWYILLPILAIGVLISVFSVSLKKISNTLFQRLNKKNFKKRFAHHQIKANDIIDVDFKEVK